MRKIKILLLLVLILLNQPRIEAQVVSENLMRAEAMILSGNPEAAIVLLNKAVLSTKDYRFFLLRAEAFIAKGDLSGAISDFNDSNSLDSLSGEYGLARVYALKGDAQTSLYHLEKNLNSDKKRSEKEIMLDASFKRIENNPDWRAFWKKNRYTESEGKVSEIEFYTSSGKIEEATILLNEIKSDYPVSDEALYSEALVYVANKKYPEAVKLLISLTEKHPDNQKYLLLLVRAQEGSLNAAGAIESYSRIIESGTSDVRILLGRASAFRKTGENEKALSDLESFLSIYPENTEALSMKGNIYLINGDNLKALEVFTRNLNLHPSNPAMYIDRANSYFASRSWQWAINDYSMSLDLNPNNSDVWINKGISLVNSGKTTEACHDFRKALSLGNKRASDFINRNCIK